MWSSILTLTGGPVIGKRVAWTFIHIWRVQDGADRGVLGLS